MTITTTRATTATTPSRPAARRHTARLRPFRTPVRGHAFAGRPPDVPSPREGQHAALVREPDNPEDPLAVAVWVAADATPWRIGYLDRGVAARVAPRLDGGQPVRARMDGWAAEPGGRWLRPVLLLLPEDDRAGASTRGGDRPVLRDRPPGSRRRTVD